MLFDADRLAAAIDLLASTLAFETELDLDRAAECEDFERDEADADPAEEMLLARLEADLEAL